MEPYTIRFSPAAAEFFRNLELFQRLPLVDVFEDIRSGKVPEEDYGEVSPEGELTQIIVLKEFAIYHQIDEEANTVFVTAIGYADKE